MSGQSSAALQQDDMFHLDLHFLLTRQFGSSLRVDR
jgi:hypothetical protein